MKLTNVRFLQNPSTKRFERISEDMYEEIEQIAAEDVLNEVAMRFRNGPEWMGASSSDQLTTVQHLADYLTCLQEDDTEMNESTEANAGSPIHTER